MRAIETLKDIVGDRPVGSSLGFWQDLEAAQVSFVLRRNQGTHPKFQDSEGRASTGPESGLSGCGGQGVVGLWERGHAKPLWMMSNLEPEEALRTYLQRMKIDATFRDRKDLLGLERRMNQSQESMEKNGGFAFGHLVGENRRDFLYGPPPSEPGEPGESPDPPAPPAIPSPEPGNPPAPPRRSRSRDSGLFVLLMQKWFGTPQPWRAIVRAAWASFPPVPTHVRT
jgi:hypothetical protein